MGRLGVSEACRWRNVRGVTHSYKNDTAGRMQYLCLPQLGFAQSHDVVVQRLDADDLVVSRRNGVGSTATKKSSQQHSTSRATAGRATRALHTDVSVGTSSTPPPSRTGAPNPTQQYVRQHRRIRYIDPPPITLNRCQVECKRLCRLVHADACLTSPPAPSAAG